MTFCAELAIFLLYYPVQVVIFLASLVKDSDPLAGSLLDLAARYFEYRFQQDHKPGDISEAITLRRRVDGDFSSDTDRSLQLWALGIDLQHRYDLLADPADERDAINTMLDAANSAPTDDENKSNMFCLLSKIFVKRFERDRQLTDIEDAITLMRAAVDSADGHPNRAGFLSDLGAAHSTRFRLTGQPFDIEEAITMQWKAFELTPEDDVVNQAACLSNLGNSHRRRHREQGNRKDLEDAISLQRRAAQMIPDGHPSKPSHLGNLGGLYTIRFKQFGDLGDIEEAILLNGRAVEASHHNPGHIDNLAWSYLCRFERLGEPVDIDQAVSLCRQAAELFPDGDPAKPAHLSNLGNAYDTRFKHLLILSDAEEAITSHRQAVSHTQAGHLELADRTSNLGNAYTNRFRLLLEGDPDDIAEAIKLHRQAVSITPDSHPNKAAYLDNLGNGLVARFQRYGMREDIEEAIEVQRLAVKLTPEGDFHRPYSLLGLGTCYLASLRSTPSPSTFVAASKAFSAAAYTAGPASVQFDAATDLKTIHEEFPDLSGSRQDLLAAHGRILELIPQVAWMGFSVSRRYTELSRIGHAASAATAAALTAGDTDKALVWFEGGRAVVWNQMMNLRTPLDGLREMYPQHADRLQQLSMELEQGGSRNHGLVFDSDVLESTTPEGHARNHRLLADKYTNSSTRSERFPGAMTSSDLAAFKTYSLRARWGTSLGRAGVRTHNYRATVQRGWDSEEGDPYSILADLWDVVVGPILQFIDHHLRLNKSDRLPRVTWCTSGALSFLPLHAAGRYGHPGDQNAFDTVISSYSPTLANLIPCPQPRRSGGRKIVVVAQPATPGATPLPGTAAEAQRIRSIVRPESLSLLMDSSGTADAVLKSLQEYDWIHLACHGMQDTLDPSQSALLLYDRALTLEELGSTRTVIGELAFLSACESAVGDEKVPDEVVHLAAGMLAVGFRSVVATMWTIEDGIAPMVAEVFYRTLIKDTEARGMMDSAYALHVAIERVRDKVGVEQFIAWVPFVHYGI
ncbi:HCP-like protein [Cylindrobasidium torrendii FP15055 ss-10]|uniref:HCP-like protein n=1 Tax=Cylindrobasidium torrendii FP15055 ss-10 TaxID=1314674 RepID=A0A0D7BF98_9AGAR|nr:HCP-like protein [Cylindrobasidium torrendii FP15055 ss-10]